MGAGRSLGEARAEAGRKEQARQAGIVEGRHGREAAIDRAVSRNAAACASMPDRCFERFEYKGLPRAREGAAFESIVK
ncbi:hypothetical protein MGN01_40280 [Methylobacterium gnaphalii]|uniref:Uncharacterized protein n=1 Tax=Methylobacterium gnaphalii TaxID=1010610 RepID=A0A512JQQ4_9HYPH|nr:hypothetical protein MGN01_40280 [Methylobacterium gnaphalii]GLS51305.1 hypothetical protein GCM10007885_41600 [Methylobacterium gnaphalii]